MPATIELHRFPPDFVERSPASEANFTPANRPLTRRQDQALEQVLSPFAIAERQTRSAIVENGKRRLPVQARGAARHDQAFAIGRRHDVLDDLDRRGPTAPTTAVKRLAVSPSNCRSGSRSRSLSLPLGAVERDDFRPCCSGRGGAGGRFAATGGSGAATARPPARSRGEEPFGCGDALQQACE